MTAGLVTNYNAVAELTNVVNTNVAKSGTNNFNDVLKTSTNKQADKSQQDIADKTAKNDIKDNSYSKNDDVSQNTKTKEMTNADKAATDKGDSSKDINEEDIENVAENLVQNIAQILNVDANVVADMMSELDIDEMSLLDGSGIADLIVGLNDAEDVMDIMTDEGLFEELMLAKNEADKALDDLSEKLGVSKEEAKDIVSEMKEEAVGNITGADADIVKNKTKDNDAGADNSFTGSQNFAQDIMNNIREAVDVKAGDEVSSYTTNMEDIYEQVSESIKLNMKEDITEMEMSLHPASLGNVKIQISAKDGMITANFTTQNEEVKNAIETQLVELKERMNEQGIKVEAVEVTVESHAFDENLSKEGERAGQEEPEKKKRRSINLNDLEEIDDISNEDEIRIAREMMMHNGTTVDYLT